MKTNKIKPLTERFSPSYWKTQITAAEERRKPFVRTAEESIRLFNGRKEVGILKDIDRRLNVWWYCNNTLLPAFYSSTPKAEVLLRKRTGNSLHETAAVIMERVVQYQLDSMFNFDQVGYNAALQFLLTGQAVLWAMYEPKFKTVFEEMLIIPGPDGGLLYPDGTPFDQDPAEAIAGEDGRIIYQAQVEVKESERAIVKVVNYADYVCSDARNESEVEWQAQRAFLSREKAESVFGKDIASDFNYDAFPDVYKNSKLHDSNKQEGKAELWEIWCQESDKVYWAHFSGENPIVQSGPPPIKYEKFYPCSVIRQSEDPDNIIPVSDYAHCKDQILEVERLTTRIHAVLQAIRPNAAYDAAMGDELENLLAGDLRMVPIINWPSYKSKGGLGAAIEFLPIDGFVNALNILQNARQAALQQLYETLKVSDLLRGASEQYKSATANRLENQWSSMGLIVRQNMFAKFISDGLGNLGTIIASQFDAKRIFDIADADNLLAQFIPPDAPPEMGPQMLEAAKMQILEFLQNNEERNYRIQVASDSMVALDQMQDKKDGAELLQTCGQFFEQSKALIEAYPPLLSFTMGLMKNLIKRFKGGKEVEAIFTRGLESVAQVIAAKEEAAKQPPPPDPKMLEMQGRLQIAQTEAQAKLQTVAIESQDRQVKNQILMQEQQIKMQRDQLEAQLAVQKQQFETYLKEQELLIAQQEAQIKANAVQVDVMKIQTQAASEKDKAMIASEANRMSGIIDMQKLELEAMRVRLSESEKLMEERRLKQEQDLERIRLSMEQIGASSQQLQTSLQKKAKKRVGKIIADVTGNPVGIEITDYDENDMENGKRYGSVVSDETGNPQAIEFNED